jgi:hypothetical protein
MSSLYSGLDVFCQLEAIIEEFDALCTFSAIPLFFKSFIFTA